MTWYYSTDTLKLKEPLEEISSDDEVGLQTYRKADNFHLVLAVINNNLRQLKHLLKAGKKLTATFRGENTLLHIAVLEKNTEIFDFILAQNDAPLDAQNGDGDTALTLALGLEFHDFATELIKQGADIHVGNKSGNTPLHFAISHRYIGISTELIEKGADINARNAKGDTPIFRACLSGCLESICMLLYYGADVSIPTHKGQTPFHVAIAFSAFNDEIPAILYHFLYDDLGGRPINLDTIALAMALLDHDFFREIVENTTEIDVDERDFSVFLEKLPEMRTGNLELFIERFGDILGEVLAQRYCNLLSIFLFHMTLPHSSWHTCLANLTLLFDSSNVAGEVVASVNRDFQTIAGLIEICHNLNVGRDTQINLIELMCYSGVNVTSGDVESVFVHFGYCPLFKMMLVMDLGAKPCGAVSRKKHVMPRLYHDVHFTIEQFVEDWESYSLDTLGDVLKFFAHQGLVDICSKNRDLVVRARNLPKVPLLVELGRNSATRFLVKKFCIESYKELYGVVNRLDVSVACKRIILLDTGLYNVVK